MIERPLTPSEAALLRPIFGETLPYDSQVVHVNEDHWGGEDNSITPGPVPLMSPLLWTPDYSNPKIPDDWRWNFIHEMTHVWQYYHGVHKLWQFLNMAATGGLIGMDYEGWYPYDLGTSYNFDDYNMEQQASIVADYYYITIGKDPTLNRGSTKERATYFHFISYVQNAGPAQVITRTEHQMVNDNIGNKI
jgi:hypothetical protein